MSTWKLQKLAYYSQAWSLVWDDNRLFPEDIEAWANGPVVRELYLRHRGQFKVTDWRWGNVNALEDYERDTIEAVVNGYGKLSGRQLSFLTHQEAPWQVAREGLAPTESSRNVISLDSMYEFYSALDADRRAEPVEEIDWSELESP